MRGKGQAQKPQEIWNQYLKELSLRWPSQQSPQIGPWGPEPLNRLLLTWENLGILRERERLRLEKVDFYSLSSSLQNRLQATFKPAALSILKVQKEHPLILHDGALLQNGRLGIQTVYQNTTIIGMNIQLQGDFSGGSIYLRIDRDPVAMGAKTGEEASARVFHHHIHCHIGKTEKDAENIRIPSACGDPVLALDYVLLQFFPEGPGSLQKKPAPYQ